MIQSVWSCHAVAKQHLFVIIFVFEFPGKWIMTLELLVPFFTRHYIDNWQTKKNLLHITPVVITIFVVVRCCFEPIFLEYVAVPTWSQVFKHNPYRNSQIWRQNALCIRSSECAGVKISIKVFNMTQSYMIWEYRAYSQII